jgi:hypothetical protein
LNYNIRLPKLSLSTDKKDLIVSCPSGIKGATEFWINSLGGITSLSSTEKFTILRTASDAIMSYIASTKRHSTSPSFYIYDRNTVYFASDARIHKVDDSGTSALSAYSLWTGVDSVLAVYALEIGQTRYVLFISGNQIYRVTDTGSSFTDLTALATGADRTQLVGLAGVPLVASNNDVKSQDQIQADCLNGACHEAGQKRSTNSQLGGTCDDQTWNQDETDVDCGGSVCPQCDYGQFCYSGSDCISGICNDFGVCGT